MFSRSVILVGMPGSGKSTIGRSVASLCGMDFIDTDELLQKSLCMSLQDYIDKFGHDAFAKAEDDFLKNMEAPDVPKVIATGGSAVLYPDAMRHLKEIGTVVFIDCDLPLLKKRLWNFESRGIVTAPGEDKEQAMLKLYMEREPLYYKYCDVRIDQGKKGRKLITDQVIEGVKEYEDKL